MAMSQSPEDPSWLPLWIAAVVPLLVALGAFVKRFLNTVTRSELREAIQDNNKLTEQRHIENQARLKDQDEELRVIRSTVSRIEGTLSGRYPKVPGP